MGGMMVDPGHWGHRHEEGVEAIGIAHLYRGRWDSYWGGGGVLS